MEEVVSDPLAALANSIRWEKFTDRSNNVERRLGFKVNHKENEYARAMYAMREDKGIPQYPNANLTMRVTYGNVGGIRPADGITYDYYSTINGYVEKCNPEDYEFNVDEKMLSLIAAKDWGRWGSGDQLRVNFLSNNDITGGNSGSPVLNARGDVVGLAFDGNRESMACDLYFHPEFAKTVSVDIRFVLWVIEKYAGAGSLIDEMKLVN